MTTRRNIVFDSWPVMAYLQGEPPVKRIIEIIADGHASGDTLLMSVINAGEVWYAIAQRGGTNAADGAIDLVRSLGIEFVDADWPLTEIAAGYKAKGGVSYADCFAAALTKQTNATLVTGDREFKRLEKELTIEWL